MSIQDVQKIMEEIDRDKPGGTTTAKKTDGESTLNFKEFCQIMGNVEGGSTAELVQSFAQKAKSESRAFQAKDPLWKTLMTQDEGEGGLSFSSGRNARMKLAQLIDGDNTQIVIMVLIALDVVAVILEIIVHNLYCPCDPYYLSDPDATESEWKTDFVPKENPKKLHDNLGENGHGWTHPDYHPSYYGSSSYGSSYGSSSYGTSSYGSHRVMMEEQGRGDSTVFGLRVSKLRWDDIYSLIGYDTEYGYDRSAHRQLAGGMCASQLQYEYTLWLQCLSLGILCLFGVQIMCLILVYQQRFFINIFYIADFIVVFGALVLEMPYDCSEDRRRLGTSSSSYGSSYSSSSYSSKKSEKAFFEDDDYAGVHFGCKNIASEGALVTIILCWRITRVVHGIFTSVELQQEKKHHAIKMKQEDLLNTMIETRRNFAKKRFVHSKYHDKLVEMGVRYLTEGEEVKKKDEAMSMDGVPLFELKERLHEAERMYATLFSYVEMHHKDLIVAERKLKDDVEHHGHGHGGHAHEHGQGH